MKESGYVRIGGIQQWVVIDGEDCRNPVVLIVHGGPGNPNTPFAGNLFGGWAKDFTVVQWDQRGSGKTYAASKPAENDVLTMKQLALDGVEIARYAALRLGKRKVILMGGSWGSALAVHMATTAPGLFYGYVGTSQLVNYQADMAVSFSRALQLARESNDSDTVAKLNKLGPPPWMDPHNFGILRRITRKYEASKTDPAPKGWFVFSPEYDTPEYKEAYEAGEDYSFLQFVGLHGDGMGPQIDLRKLNTAFPFPVYLIQGEDDLVTPPAVSRAYFDDLSAPKKEFLLLPRTGHDPNTRMIETQFKVLNTRLRNEAMARDGQ